MNLYGDEGDIPNSVLLGLLMWCMCTGVTRFLLVVEFVEQQLVCH